jgi:hypothetical protein
MQEKLSTHRTTRMKQANTLQHLSLKGKVIEIFQKGGKRLTRVSVNSFYLDLPSDHLLDAHLKDDVVIRGCLSVEGVENDFTASVIHSKSNET